MSRRSPLFVALFVCHACTSGAALHGDGGGASTDGASTDSSTQIDGGAQALNPSFALWVEQPTIEKVDGYFETFYGDLANFVAGNPADIAVTKVLLRVLDPSIDFGAAGNPWMPSLASPLYTHLIARLPDNVPIYIMPYVAPAYPWGYQAGKPIIEQVMHLVAEWNQIIASADPQRVIRGVVYDPEGSGIAKEVMIADSHHYMSDYGLDLKLAMTLPGKAIEDAVRWGMASDDSHLDEAYLQLYNLYTSCDPATNSILVDSFQRDSEGACNLGGCDPTPACGSSIYLDALEQDDPAAAIFADNGDYNFKTILTQPQMNWNLATVPAGAARYIYPMFSIEALVGANCIIPNSSTSDCGQVNAFGSWPAQDFLDFVSIFNQRVSELAVFEGESIPPSNYAIFQYAFLPRAWVGD